MKKMIVYFSYSNTTKRKAEALSKELHAELFELCASQPYSAQDVNWQDDTSRNVKEYKDASCRPEIKEMPDLSDVDEIWVGYPIWWYTHPRIINTFFDQADLKGKTIHLFATSGGTGINGSLQELKKEYPSLHIVDGKRM